MFLDNFSTQISRSGFQDTLLAFLSPQERRSLRWVFALILAGAFCESAGLALVIPYINFLQNPPAEPFYSAWLITGAFGLIILFRMGMQLFVSHRITQFAYQIGENHSKRMFERYIYMDYKAFLLTNSSSLVKNCTHSVDEAAFGLLIFLQFTSAFCVVVGLTAVLLWDNAVVTITIILALASISIPIYKYFKRRQRQAGQERDNTLADLCKLSSESFQCFKEIHLYNKEPYFGQRFAALAEKLRKANVKSTFYPLLPGPCIEAAAMAALLGVVLWFLWSGTPLQQLVPQLIFYGVIGRRLLPSLHQAIYFGMALQKLQPCMELVHREFVQTTTRCHLNTPPASFAQEVCFHTVSFAYQPDRPALQEVSLALPCNRSIALVGPSGAGKSTIMELFTALLHPSQGHFSIDGKSVDVLTALRGQIGYVPQMVNLIDDTVERNIAFGEEQIDQERLNKAMRMAHLDEFIGQLPQGLQTVIGERGVRLSGGQRQRIGIARALYYDPKIVIFDEATASLDTVSEKVISDNILEIAGHKTIFAIAHRISTIKDFDRIYVLDAGRIISSGTHQELIQSCTLYKAMNASSS